MRFNKSNYAVGMCMLGLAAPIGVYAQDVCAMQPGGLIVSGYLSDGLHLYAGPDAQTPGACIGTLAALDQPYYATFGAGGDLYVSGGLANRVYRIDGCSGALLPDAVPFGLENLNGAKGLAFGPDGRLYVCSSENDMIFWFDLQTGASGLFADADDCGLDHPNDIAFPGDGFAYVAEGSNRTGRILKFDMSGSCSLFATTTTFNSGIDGLTRTLDGDWYATAQVGAGSTVIRFDGATGAVEGEMPDLGCIHAIRGRVAIDAAGRLYVCSSHSDEVLRIADWNTGVCETYASGCGLNEPFNCMFIPPDTDGDGLHDATDNCPAVTNADQADCDSDGIGDVCDTANEIEGDLDHDGDVDLADLTRFLSNFGRTCPQP